MKKKKKLTPNEKVLAGAIGAVIFPFALTLGVYKEWDKKHGGGKKRRRRR